MSVPGPAAASPGPVLELRGVTKRFGRVVANEDVSLSLGRGEIVALLGENGAGKTTLMNVLFGHYRADAGSVTVFGEPLANHTPDEALAAGVGMVHQHFTLAEDLTVLDNVVLGTESLWQPFSRRRAARDKLRRIVGETGLDVPLDARITTLTVGERQRVEILKALYRDVRILILDEPTAVLTPQEVDELFARLRRMVADGLSIIVISHKLHEVLALADRVVVLRGGRVAGEARTSDVDRDALADMIVGRRIERPTGSPHAPGKILLSIADGRVDGARSGRRSSPRPGRHPDGHPGRRPGQRSGRAPVERSGERRTTRAKPLLDGIGLDVAARTIVGVAGVSGNGQATLAEVLSGLRPLDAGTLAIDGTTLRAPTPRALVRLGLARIPEDRHRHGVVGEMTLWENLALESTGERPFWRGGLALDRRRARAHAAGLVERFDVRTSGVEQPAGLLSGGNMQKLILARNLAREPRLILANQPTRGLDEGAIAAVHAQLLAARDAGAGILLITEDLDELLRLADTIVVMHDGRLSAPRPARGLDVRELGLAMTTGDWPERRTA